jgi:hypothetical protein
MSRFRSFVLLQLPLLTIAALLISGALGQQNPPASQVPPPAASAPKSPVPPPPEAKPDANATAAVNKAIDALDPRKLGYVETKLWEQVDTIGLSFQATGKYLSAPKDRMRLEMNVRVGNTDSKLLVVSDGSWVWTEMKLGNDEPLRSKYDLREVHKNLSAPGTMPTVSEGFYRSQSFRGIVPLLQTLAQQMVFTKFESTTWNGKDVYKLTGAWNADLSKKMSRPDQPWPLFTPKTCYVYLARENGTPAYWPYRLEWWGPGLKQSEDALLMQMEFREPKVSPADKDTPKEYASLFVFHPGEAKVLDLTQKVVKDIIQARNQPAPIQPAGAAPAK